MNWLQVDLRRATTHQGKHTGDLAITISTGTYGPHNHMLLTKRVNRILASNQDCLGSGNSHAPLSSMSASISSGLPLLRATRSSSPTIAALQELWQQHDKPSFSSKVFGSKTVSNFEVSTKAPSMVVVAVVKAVATVVARSSSFTLSSLFTTHLRALNGSVPAPDINSGPVHSVRLHSNATIRSFAHHSGCPLYVKNSPEPTTEKWRESVFSYESDTRTTSSSMLVPAPDATAMDIRRPI